MNISDEKLLERAVTNCRHRQRGYTMRWTAVMDTFVLGRTYSCELCERFGLDPDEMVKR